VLRIQRALLLELLLVFAGVLVVVTAVVFVGSTFGLVGKAEGAGTALLLRLMPALLPIAMAYSLPFAWLAAVAFVVGRMVHDREVMAMRAAGIHLGVVVVPALGLGAAISLGGVALNAYALPAAHHAISAGAREYLPQFLGSLKDVDRTVALSNGRFSFDRYEAGSFWDVELDRRDAGGTLELKVLARRVTIQRHGEGGEQALQFTFEDGYVLQTSASEEPTLTFEPEATLQMGRVERLGASVLFNDFFGTRRFVERPQDLTVPDLAYAAARGGVWRGSPVRVAVWLHRALALGWAPLAMSLFALGMALALPASGRKVRDFLLCFLPPVLLYFPLFMSGPALGLQGTLPPWLALWSATLVVAASGAVLLVVAFRR
jgi:lipopolysaccharide export LptBFGC system permease protein LptF